MKKSLAILLSLVLVAAAVFALAITANADDATATSVQIKAADGSSVLATLDGTTTEYSPASGKISFDAATGTVTLDNVDGEFRIESSAGNVTFKLEGTNVISSTGNTIWISNGSVAFNGTGSLSITNTDSFAVYANGDMIIDDAAITVNSTNIIYEWHSAVYVEGGFEMNSGSLVINATCTNSASPVGVALMMMGSIEDSVANFNGGEIEINVSNTYVPDANGNDRVIGIYGGALSAMNFNGTDVTINATCEKGDNVTTANAPSSTGLIFTQKAGEINLNAGDIALNGGEGAIAAIGTEQAATVVSVTGAKVTGDAQCFVQPWGGSPKYDIDSADLSGFTSYEKTIGAKSAFGFVGTDDVFATKVEIAPAQGIYTTLNSSHTTLSAAEAVELDCATDAFVFNPYDDKYGTPTLTLNGVTEACKGIRFDGTITIVLKGENVIKSVDPVGGNTAYIGLYNYGANGKLFFAGDGSLDLLGTYSYAVVASRVELYESAKVSVINNGTVGVHVGASATRASVVKVRGNATLTASAKESAIYLPGSEPTVLVTENGTLNVKALETGTVYGIRLLLNQWREGAESQKIIFEASGNATVNITGCEIAFYDHMSAWTSGTEGIKEEMPVEVNVTFKDNAKVTMVSLDETMYLHPYGRKNSTANFTMSGNAYCYLESTDAKKTGKHSCAIYMEAEQMNMNILGNSKLEALSHSSGWTRATLYFAYGSGNANVRIEDATVSLTNVTVAEAAGSSDSAEIANAIMAYNASGTITIAGKANFSSYSEHNGTYWSNRAHGAFLNGNFDIVVEDDAKATFAVGGDSAAATAAGIHIKGGGGEVIVKDNGVLTCKTTTKDCVAGITLEGDAKLVTEGNATVLLDASKGGVGIRNYHGECDGSIDVKGGTVKMIGDPAVSDAGKALVIECSKIIADGNEVKELSFSEKEVVLKGRNPITSDLTVTVFVILALATVAVACAISLRKRYNA